MSYQANVYNVMIASPSDVIKERQLIQEIVYEWDYIHSLNKGIVLLPVCWETHSSPEMGDRPQAILNKQIVEIADLLVGVFWTRIGTPTGEAVSGTVEEITKHVDAKKPAMIYFSNAPAYPETIDPKQYEELKKFKDWCKGKGLIETYETTAEFGAKFSRQLAIKINQDDYFKKSENLVLTESENVTEMQIPTLSEKAEILLIEISKDPQGHLLKIRSIGQALAINTNSKNFTGANTRENAEWESAVEELLSYGFIQERGYKGEVFSITHEGYKMADFLQQKGKK